MEKTISNFGKLNFLTLGCLLLRVWTTLAEYRLTEVEIIVFLQMSDSLADVLVFI